MRYALSFVLIVVAACTLHAQQPLVKSNLETVSKDGFYKIEIKPDLTPYLSSHFSNLRIHDADGYQVPYLIETEEGYSQSEFAAYPIVDLSSKQGCCTDLVISNPNGRMMNNFSLRIRNADVLKKATLSGSDDKQKWFALRDEFPLYPINSSSSISEVRVIDFPLANYRFYKLSINDSSSAPLNIVEAGHYRNFEKKAVYNDLLVAKATRKDSSEVKRTYFRIELGKSNWVDRVTLNGRGPALFMRPVRLYAIGQRVDRKGEVHETFDLIGESSLSHDQEAEWKFSGRKVKGFLIEIENHDNPALKELSANMYQLRRNAVAWLQAGENYSIVAGAAKLEMPEYDLKHFSNRIPRDIEPLSYDKLKSETELNNEEKANPSWQNSLLLWIGLGGIILILGLMSARMIRQMKKE